MGVRPYALGLSSLPWCWSRCQIVLCKLAFVNPKECDSKTHNLWDEASLSNSARLLLPEHEEHWIICRHQCLVVTWSFMDQLFPFWFNSPCDWFSAQWCWNRKSFEYRCLRLRPHATCSQETIAGWLCCYWQKLLLPLYEAEIFAFKCLL